MIQNRTDMVSLSNRLLVTLLLAGLSGCGQGDGERDTDLATPEPGASEPVPAPVASSDEDPAPGGEPGDLWQRPEPPDLLLSSVSERNVNPQVNGEDLTALVRGNTEFAFDMFRLMRAANPDVNIAFGPYSVTQAFAMLYAGARGETELSMQDAFGFGPQETVHNALNGLDLELMSRNTDVLLRNANQLWLHQGFAPLDTYVDLLMEHYGAPPAVLDFGDPDVARATINGWVSSVTEEKIPELFPMGTIDTSTRMVLTNAMFMDAPWKYPFDPEDTRTQEFALSDGAVVAVPMMHYDLFLPSASNADWQAVQIPYAGDELAMVVVVPRNLATFEASLDAVVFDSIVSQIDDGGIHLSMPKFTFSYHASLVEPLKEMGLGELFTGPDLSGIGGGLTVTAVEHEAFINVDEEGTEAAAATGIALADSHGPSVTVDRPFLYFILDKPTRSLLFMGRVLDPTAE